MLARSGVEELIAGCGAVRVLPVVPQVRSRWGAAAPAAGQVCKVADG